MQVDFNNETKVYDITFDHRREFNVYVREAIKHYRAGNITKKEVEEQSHMPGFRQRLLAAFVIMVIKNEYKDIFGDYIEDVDNEKV